MNWFGNSWDAPLNKTVAQIPVPVGNECIECGEKFTDDQNGLRLPFLSTTNTEPFADYHWWCFLVTMFGPLMEDMWKEFDGDQFNAVDHAWFQQLPCGCTVSKEGLAWCEVHEYLGT